MKRIRVEYRLIVTKPDGSEYGGRIVYRRTTAAQRLLDYEKDHMAARYEVWSNETGEWKHLASNDRQNGVTAQGQPLRKRAAGQTFDYDPSNEAAHLPPEAISFERLGVRLEAQVKPKLPAPWGQTSGSIVTKRGKKISKKQYVALVHAQQAKDIANECKDGHVECAAWYKGPCSAELTDGQEDA